MAAGDADAVLNGPLPCMLGPATPRRRFLPATCIYLPGKIRSVAVLVLRAGETERESAHSQIGFAS